MKKLFTLLTAAFVFTVAAFGQVVQSGTITAATTTLLLSTPASILSLTVIDTSGSANAVVFYDNNTASSTNIIRPSYTARGQYLTNRVSTYTSATGVSVSLTNTVLFPYNYTVAATTNEANRVFYTIVPASGRVEPDEVSMPLGVSRGLSVRTVGNASYILTYVPQL